jgi:CRP/FNR family cyclic AMP-dependent transcriptional regulator
VIEVCVVPIDHELLADVKFFALYDEEDRQAFAKVVDHVRLPATKTLFERGDTGDALYIVLSGRVELYIRNVTGEKLVLTCAERGDFFGELSIADMGPRTATAVALEDSELIVLSRDNLRFFFQKRPDAALDLIAAMANMIRNADELLNKQVARNVNVEIQEHITTFQKVADWIAWFSGSMYFLLINTLWFFGWIAVNTLDLGIRQFDPFPFGLLTMIVSLEAIFLSIFVLISQNRQAEKDRVRSEIDYEVNVKAELEIAHLHDKTDRLQEKVLERFSRLEKMLHDRDSVAK